jgi:hypothetical protein
VTIPLWLQAAASAALAALAWLWWGKRKATQRADAAERRAEHATAERDQARGDVAVADATRAAVTEHAAGQQRGHEAAGRTDAKPLPADPVAARDALYDRLRDAAHGDGAGARADRDPAVRAVPLADPGAGRARRD